MDSLRKKIIKPIPKKFISSNISLSARSQKKHISEAKSVSDSLFVKKNTPTKKRRILHLLKKIVLILGICFLIGILIIGIFFIYKLNTTTKKISANNSDTTQIPILETLSDISKITSDKRNSLNGEENQRINILLLGIAGNGKPGGDLTDTIMIASIDTKDKKIALLSLPRDLYTSVPKSNYSAKINSLYKYGLNNEQGIEPLKKAVENITNLSINYYLIVNFSGFESFIDDIGGINIEVHRDIYDSSYPGPNYSYETFELKKGFHKLDGATALKYARERHDDPEGDFGRAKRQQQVIQAAKNKVFSTKTLLNPFAINKLLNTLGENVKTNMTLDEIDSFIKLTKNIDTQNINNAVVDAWKEDSLLKVSHIFYENTQAFILVPRIGNYTEIQDLAKNIFDLRILEKRKLEIKNENPRIALIDKTTAYNTYLKIEKLLKKKLGFENVEKLNIDTNFSTNKTAIFDLTSGKKPFSLDELIKKIPANLNKDSSSAAIELKESIIEYDILIILGKELNDIYQYDEDSIEDLQKSEANEEVGRMN